MDARTFALKFHGDQMYGDNPYSYHLDAVAGILSQYAYYIQEIAFLHDVIEDTDATFEDVESVFGTWLAECVYLLTDCEGETREQRKQSTHVKLSNVGFNHHEALIAKAADRLANCRVGGKLDMYRKEHGAFKAAVYRKGICEEIWQELDEILFPSGK